MRITLLASLALASALSAQTPNYFEIYSGCTNYTSRGALSVNAGDILVEVNKSHFQGVALNAAGTGTQLNTFRYVMQDQNAATQEAYSLVVRPESAPNSNSPDCVNPPMLTVGPFMSPSGAATLAWIITATIGTPSTVLPVADTIFHGVNVPANANWTHPTDGDGLSIHIATYYLLGTTQADNPALNQPSIGWNCLNNAPVQPTFANTPRLALGVPGAVANLGNADPTLIGNTANCVSTLLNASGNPTSYGAGGMWPVANPSAARQDGIDVKIADASRPNSIFASFLAGAGLLPSPIPIAFLGAGGLWMNPAGITQLAVGTLDAAGGGRATLLPPGIMGANLQNRPISFQSFVFGTAITLPGAFTNATTTIPKP